jgi:hypothetical protein
MPPVDPVALIAAADEQVAKVRTQGKDYSFNELLSMHEEGELVINPEYQRLFRWSEEKESRFIESLILELPLPPLFVIEVKDGQYELIDGLQRISSYFHFRGKLSAPHRGIQVGDSLRLIDCDIVAALNGYTYEELPRALEIKLKRHSVRVEVIRKESDKRLRYHMFKRLNTGGVLLSEQEIRNCTIRLLDSKLVNFIAELSQTEDFKECISLLAEERFDAKGDQELVLRFFTFKNWKERYVKDVHAFMTQFMETVSSGAEAFDYSKEKKQFDDTFRVLRRTLGPQSFSSVKQSGDLYPFTVYQYESFVFGIQPHMEKLLRLLDSEHDSLKDLFWKIKRDPQFREITTGGGLNTKAAFQQRVDFVASRLGTGL